KNAFIKRQKNMNPTAISSHCIYTMAFSSCMRQAPYAYYYEYAKKNHKNKYFCLYSFLFY
ncbi:hypothetical protein MAH48_15330, partial [Anoxybacillus flavithermus]|nr:hypothetical protein [Anoxybacillus flavithermus]